MSHVPGRPAGLYVHIPFCLTRCGYCDFNAYADLDHLRGRYARAVAAEADLAAAGWRGDRFDSVFFGGGTPTQMETDDLTWLVKQLRSTFSVSAAAEITMEANPDTVDEPTLSALRGAGVSRLSMGAQSFDKDVLEALERVHQPESVRSAFADARAAGFDDVNLDLIFGAETETLTSWMDTLEQAIELGPEHISAYALTVEPSTPLGRKVASGAKPAPDPDLQADMYAAACERLRDAGFEHYEVSNWAKPGRECRHNKIYWRRGSYLGLGAGAHSHRDGRRWWNLRPPEQYLQEVEAGRLPVGGKEHLSAGDMRLEEVLLRLRMREGISAAQVDEGRASSFASDGLLERRGPNWVLTESGMFLANEIIVELAG